MVVELHLPDQAVLVALVTGGTTVAVASIKAVQNVVIAWIQASHGQPSSPEIEPPDP